MFRRKEMYTTRLEWTLNKTEKKQSFFSEMNRKYQSWDDDGKAWNNSTNEIKIISTKLISLTIWRRRQRRNFLPLFSFHIRKLFSGAPNFIFRTFDALGCANIQALSWHLPGNAWLSGKQSKNFSEKWFYWNGFPGIVSHSWLPSLWNLFPLKFVWCEVQVAS